MTTPASTPGESEFCWGKGIEPPQERGYQPTEFDKLKAIYLTEKTNPNANEDATRVATPTVSHVDEKTGLYVAGDLRAGVTQRVVEKGPSAPQTVFPDRYNIGHEPDGIQDGNGRAWRENQPPNPVGEFHEKPVFGGAVDSE